MRRSVSKARKPSWAPGARPARAPPATARLISTSRATALGLAPRGRSGPSAAVAARAFSASAWRLAETVKVPQMAESISEGTLKQWVKKKGDYVEADEEVATIETDKIDVSVNAPKAGTITELLAEEEDTVSVGQDLFKLEPGEGGAKSGGGEEKPKDEGKSSESEEKPKDEGKDESKSSEDKPAKEDKPAPAKEDKPSSKSASPPGQQRKKSNAEVEERESEPERPEPKHSQDDKRPAAKSSDEGDSTTKKPPQPKSDESQTPAISKPTGGERKETRVKMNRMRLRIAERLKQSQNTAASLTTFNEIDMSSLMEMRKLYKDAVLKQHGVKLGFMSAFSRAATIALQEIPAANASIENGEQIVYRDYVDLSVAVATPKGLVTPVIRNVETMSMRHIEQAIADAGKKARDGKLTLEDMSGGTFTISNGGVFGSLFGTPIINMPQTAVLGLHAINSKPVVLPDGSIAARPIMVVALTYDHRLLDGREAVTLLVRIKQLIEDPRRMLLDI